MNLKTQRKASGIITKRDIILIAAVLLVSITCGIWYYLAHRTPAHTAEVRVDGNVVAVLDLSKNQEYTTHSKNGGTNVLKIENGMVWCEDASCPDKICEYQGKQYLDRSMIVCLPNDLIVTVISNE